MVGRSQIDPGGEDERILLAARGDPDAFVEFYDQRCSVVAGYFYKRTLCPHTTAELTAETFARVWATRMRFDPTKGSAAGWTMGIARNLYRQWSERGEVDDATRARLSVTTPDLTIEDFDYIENLVDLEALRVQLLGALSRLKPKVRDAVELRVLHDLPYEAVALQLNCSPGAARVRVSRGLDALFHQLEGQV